MMMSRPLLLPFLLLLCSNLFAQITITNSIFPQEGDVYFTSQDTATPGVMITAPGPGQTWVFDNFVPPSAQTFEVIAAADGSVGADYPDADIVIPQFGGEGYASNSGDSVEVVGFYGDGGFGLGAAFNVRLDPTMIAVQTPVDYGNIFEDDYSFQVQIDPDDYPAIGGILDSISPVPIDSIRMTYEATRYDTIDAWGNLTTNHGSFDVLRLKREEETFTTLEVKTFGFWIDATTIAPDLPFAGADTTVTYDFIAEGEIVQIMSVRMGDNDEISNVTYKVDTSEVVPPEPSAITTQFAAHQMEAFPNPAQDEVKISFQGITPARYRLEFYDALGRSVYQEDLQINGDFILPVNIKSFPQGSYYYSLKNEGGMSLLTKKLVK